MTNRPEVAPGNEDMAQAWNDGNDGRYWATHPKRFDQGIAAYQRPFFDAAAIGKADRVLDIGCGAGQTTRDAARLASSGSALGVDLSSALLEFARRTAASEGLDNVTFDQGDAQIYPFEPGAFDLAISRNGSMFFSDKIAAFTNIARALREDGRLVLLTWQPMAKQEWTTEFRTALAAGRELPTPPPEGSHPWSLSDPDRVREILGSSGFTDVDLADVHKTMWFGHDAEDAFDFVLGQLNWMLEDLDDAKRTHALSALRDTTTAHQGPDGVTFDSAVWIITARKG